MLIVKPYGRSRTRRDASGRLQRDLYRNDDRKTRHDIELFARSHDELIIAQWISTIDKIAAKPAVDKAPTDEQRAFRDRLGGAAWKLLEETAAPPGFADAERKAHLKKLWALKIAPYDDTKYRGKQGQAQPSAKGRWYRSFAGDAAVRDADVGDIAAKIHAHLHVAERRIDGRVKTNAPGRIEARAQSIAVNALKESSRRRTGRRGEDWTEADERTYARAGDVAREIRLAAEKKESENRRVSLDVAAAVLFTQYARLFHDHAGAALTIEAAGQASPGLLALHLAVKDCYSRILKRHRKDQKAHGAGSRKVSQLLPKTAGELFALVGKMDVNRGLNAAVRLGKIIHYEAALGAPDAPAAVLANWPTDVSASVFWTSDGQAEIKRNEAYVRIWRHVLALASRTLRDWADPQERIGGDILLNAKEATGADFDEDSYERKLPLLFGARASLFPGGAHRNNVLKFALEGVAALRHSAFHFKGLGGFAKALAELHQNADATLLAAVRELWEEDARQRGERLRAALQAAFCADFLDAAQNKALFDALLNAETAPLPLPRFNRFLQRAEGAWKEEEALPLPQPPNRAELESHPARLCQYVSLKLLYERPFRDWLARLRSARLNDYISRATKHATTAARELNAKDDAARGKLIFSRAERLPQLAEGEDLLDFFFNLSAATATEMRVQRAYKSDAERAKKQAEFIEKLKCDMLALAFVDYLRESGFAHLARLSPQTPKPDAPLCDLGALSAPQPDVGAADWQVALYFLAHLAPVEEIGKLLHQLRKWEILAGKSTGVAQAHEARALQSVLSLYLDMHDAKFEGGGESLVAEEFAALFESRDDFHAIFPMQPGEDEDGRIPRRGLREIMRFGHLPALRDIFAKHLVRADEVAEWREFDAQWNGKSVIACQQERREKLHEKWTRGKKRFTGADRRAYVEMLRGVMRHRHLAARVTLTDHVRLHRLMMRVLGRLVDYAGLWERDLYFTTLAAIHDIGVRPDAVFKPRGIRLLGNGQIVSALRELADNSDAARVKTRLQTYFGEVWAQRDANVDRRNNCAHFNMLQKNRPAFDLTACVNDARRLMAYDRKLKNAVSQSVKELLARDGVDLEWTIEAGAHDLARAKLATRKAQHLGGLCLYPRGGDRRKGHDIAENLHGDDFVQMVASLFGGGAERRASVRDLTLDAIDWRDAESEQKSGGRERRKAGGPRKNFGRKSN